ncbi:flagellar export chaperone FliS [Cellulomonas sp. P22]|uniref:flagellar export chaperone FliS n=1 Tax=Cellulomonas sp. P22 TaxID=3373189 RepID=UPI00378EA2E2
MYDVRSRYLADTVATVGPARLLTMLYDRMLLDVERAEVAQRQGDRVEGTAQLTHAQEIIAELIASLDTGVWDGGPGLLSLYSFLLTELIEASMTGDADRTAGCRELIAPLRDAWHDAAAAVAPAPASEPVAAGALMGDLGVG